MTPPDPSLDAPWSDTALLQQLPWLRGLARRVLGDPGLAEDAVQDTVLAALQSRPEGVRSIRAWLATTLRRGVAHGHKSERARHRREEAVAGRQRQVPGVDDSVAEIEAYQNLLEAIHALGDPYRSTLMRRFAKGETPAEIASATGVPLKTVHTRIRRGVERLRAALDVRYRDRGGMAAFGVAVGVPLAGPAALASPPSGIPAPASLSISLLSGIAMQTKALLLTVAAGLLLGLAWLWVGAESGGPRMPEASKVPVQVAAAPEGDTAQDLPMQRTDADAETPRPGQPAEAIASPATDAAAMVVGFVYGLDGRPVAEVEVGFERLGDGRYQPDPEAPTATADANGRFQLPLPRGRGRVTVLGPRHACAVHGALNGALPAGPLFLVVAPAGRCTGRVLDASAAGQPLAGARVLITPPSRDVEILGTERAVVPVPSSLVELRAAEDGRFDTGKVAWLPGSVLVVQRDGFVPATMPLESPQTVDLRVLLQPREPGGAGLHGVVLDGKGRPVERAMVSAGDRGVETGADGRFHLPELPERHRGREIRAAKVGLGIVSMPLKAVDPDAGVVLVIRSDGTRGIHGSVVDAEGQPVPGALVWTPDTSFFGSLPLRHKARTTIGIRTVEGFLADGPATDWSHGTTADTKGRFALRNLLDRPYGVFVLDPATLAAVGPVTVQPVSEGGAGIELRIPGDPTLPVSGQLVGPNGQPIAGAKIRVGRRVTWQRPVRDPDPWAAAPVVPPEPSRLLDEPRVITDAEGRFELGGLAIPGSFLSAQHPDLIHWVQLELASVPDPRDFRWQVEMRSTFRLVLDSPGEADAFGIETPSGGRAPLYLPVEDSVLSTPEVELVNGRSPEVYSRAREVVVILFREGEEVRRRTMRLPPGGVHELRP